jgi:hypothetical protein
VPFKAAEEVWLPEIEVEVPLGAHEDDFDGVVGLLLARVVMVLLELIEVFATEVIAARSIRA